MKIVSHLFHLLFQLVNNLSTFNHHRLSEGTLTMKKMFEDADEYVDLKKNVFLYFDDKYTAWIFAKKPQDVKSFICFSKNLEDEPFINMEGNIQCIIDGEYNDYNDLNVVENKCQSCTTTTTSTTITTTTAAPPTTTTTTSPNKQGNIHKQH